MLENKDEMSNAVEELLRMRLTEQVANVVHAIQSSQLHRHDQLQRELAIEETTVSPKLGEDLCCVMEAVFLHGLAPSTWTVKLSSAFGISKSSLVEGTNFWNVVSGVSHRDVLQRITELAHARSPVSQCRAWMRVAFNDGLLQSYLIAISNNQELYQLCYQTWAFLRDRDSVDLVHNLLLGLQNFVFKLDIGSGDLSRWDRRTLIMAGLLNDRSYSRTCSGSPSIILDEPMGRLSAEVSSEGEISSTDDLTVIHTRTRPKLHRHVSRHWQPSPISLTSTLPDQSQPTLIPPIHHNVTEPEGADNELDAILRLSNTETVMKNYSHTTKPSVQVNVSSPTTPLPIGVKTLGSHLGEDLLLDESYSSGHSGNLLAKNTGWSSSYEDSPDVLRPSSSRKHRSDTRESFDAVVERGVALATSCTGFSSSLGIGLSQFAGMVNDIQSASSTTTTPNNSLSGTISTDGDHGFEVLDSKDFISSRSLEGKKRELLVRIPVEKGLRAQHYKCGGCSRTLPLGHAHSRLCNFDRLYYCLDCHINDESVIPSRLIHNWDFRKYKVCSRARELIETIETSPIFDMKELNAKLYVHIKQMEEMQSARVQLQVVKSYLWTCKKDVCEQFNQKLWPHDHLHESIHIYALSDLVLIHNGQLMGKLKTATQFAIEHIRKCFLCSQRGFICEVCRSGQVLHAFDTKDNYQCLKCFAVFHKKCMNAAQACPKCQRKQRHAQRVAQLPSS